MADLRPDLGPALAAFGLPATIHLPGENPVATTAVWLAPVLVGTEGVLVQTSTSQAVLLLPGTDCPRDDHDLPTVPRGTVIRVAARAGGTVRSWMVESIASQLPDEIRVVVIPAEAP